MNNKIYNWGIIAPGGIAKKFANDLQFVSNARLHAVASRNLDRAATFAKEYGAKHAYGSYEEIVNCPDLDVIYIATPHSEHYSNTLMCLNAGIPVLCEKAFAVNSRQLDEMVNLARSKKIFLQEAIWTRFHPSVKKVFEILESGVIGKIVHIAADFGFKAPYDLEGRMYNIKLTGGSIMDIGLYPLFISKLLLGNPKTIKAVGTLAVTGIDVNCTMAFNYESGATASLYSTVATETNTVCTIFGENGQIHMHSRFHEAKGITLTVKGEEPVFYEVERLGFGYCYEAADVQRCLAEGRTENNLLTLDFSQELMNIMEEVRKQVGVIYPED